MEENRMKIALASAKHLYRRVSKGWKEYWRTDSHYREGDMGLFHENGDFALEIGCFERRIGLWGVKKVRPVLPKTTVWDHISLSSAESRDFFTPPTN
jgi:hypothetical protein